MGQIMLNGNAYAGADGGACGCFVDTSNVIKANSAMIDLPYVATQDCAVYVSVSATNVGVFFSVDGEILYSHRSSDSFTYTNTIFLRRGQSLDMTQTGTLSSPNYTVYGVIQGLDSTAQSRYSTSEKAVGVWVDGSTIYEKTIHVSSVSLQQDAKQTIEASFAGNKIISYSGYDASSTTVYSLPDGRLRLMIENGDLKIQSINGGTWGGEAYITVRYTKAST